MRKEATSISQRYRGDYTQTVFHTKSRPAIVQVKLQLASGDGDGELINTNFLSKVRVIVTYPIRKVISFFRKEKSTEEIADTSIADEAKSMQQSDEQTIPKVFAEDALNLDTGTSKDSVSVTSFEVEGDRWAISAPKVDISGKWNLIVTDEFKEEYDKYLTLLGQPFLVRSVALTIVGLTTEETAQSEKGKKLLIKGTNVRGVWERTLVASGADGKVSAYTPIRTPIETADGEEVEAEAWWEERGTVHRSWMRGVKKYGGGDFESKRYLEDNGEILVCESTFHPIDETREKARVTWRFKRAP